MMKKASKGIVCQYTKNKDRPMETTKKSSSTDLSDNEWELMKESISAAFSSRLWLSLINPLNPKKHGRLPKSIFRLVFDFLRHIIFDLHLNYQPFFNPIKFLSYTLGGYY
jgi:hypothetical protein